MNYYSEVDNSLENATSNYDKLISMALGTAQSNKDEQKEAAMNKALLAEGFRPVITPDKQEMWIPKPKVASDDIQPFQKSTASMSPELLQQTYPFLQYAEKHFIPVVEQLVTGLQNQQISLQYFQEQLLALMNGGVDEAVKATGGYGKQGKGAVAESTSAAETAAIIRKEKNAYKMLTKVSDYADNQYMNIEGGKK
jgi:hypothetical protein